MNTEPWVTAEHVAQHLGVAKDTVYRWRERMGLPAHRVGRLWKLQLSKRDEWVRAGDADEEQHNEAPFRLLEPVPELSCGPTDSGNLIVLDGIFGVTDRSDTIVQRLIQAGRIIFGENEIQAIFPEDKRPFGFPKSTELIEELLSFATGDGSMTLDSFSGSGTTTNTPLKQNRADGQTRRFILIEMKDAVGKAYQQALFGDDVASRGTVTDQYTLEFHAPAYAPTRDYNGRFEHFDFRKYFYGRIGDFASKVEFECNCHLEMCAQQECIKFWMSNLVQRECSLFFLQKADGRLYPNFLCQLSGSETQSESTFTVEFKGAECWNGAEDDRLIDGLRTSLSED